jgi:hypothetical protein
VKRADNDNTSSNHGLDWASFMMGLPTGVSIDSNDSMYLRTPRRALFFQDDWRLSSKLRLSLGLRWEHEGGSTERYNRGIVGAFAPEVKLPYTDMVQAAYAANPIPELPASQFKALGGTRYLGADGYGSVTKGVDWWLPKAGIVYSLNNKTVIRAGWGMYADTYNIANSQPIQTGFSLPTGTTLSNDLGLTFCCGVGAAGNLTAQKNVFTDPFPVRADGTRFDVPLRNALGYIPQVGRGYNSSNYALDWNWKPAIQNRWRIGFQRELARNLMIDVSYNGSYSKLPQQYRIDALPAQYWATGNTRNQAQDDLMNANVANPFNIKNLSGLATSDPTIYKYLSTQGTFTSTTIRKNTLLRPFGTMSDVRGIRPGDSFDDKRGYMNYKDLELLLERRFTKGLQASFMYTWASSWAANWMANEFDTAPTLLPNNNVMPHRIAVTATYEMPWGKNRTWIKDGFLSYLIGNWNTGGVFQLQSGPTSSDWGNRYFYGDMNNLETLFNHDAVHSKDIHAWFDPSIAYRGTGAIPSGFNGFEGRSANQPGSYSVRMFPLRVDALRSDGINNLDLKIERMFPIKPEKGIQARFSVDLLNAFNHTNFAGPNLDPTNSNFGRVDTQRGLSRVIQFNLRFEF